MRDILSINFEDIRQRIASAHGSFDEDVAVFNFKEQKPNRLVSKPTRLNNAFCVLLCRNGEMTFSLDYLQYTIKKNSVLWLNTMHVFDNINVNSDFEGNVIIVSDKLASSVFNKILGIAGSSSKNINFLPIIALNEFEFDVLSSIISRIIRLLDNNTHNFKQQILKNTVSDLLLEIANIKIEKDKMATNNAKFGYKEDVIRKFIRLIITNCKQQHDVKFYTDKIGMTVGNFNRILKSFNGKTANDMINEALLTEAKILLQQQDKTISDIAFELNFSDQSSFGRFFKNGTGQTPKEYRNE